MTLPDQAEVASIIRVLGVIGDSDPAFLTLVETLFKFVKHAGSCGYLQPMWHQVPCDCGLHEVTSQLPQWFRERLLVLQTEGTSSVYGPDPYGLFKRTD